MHNALTSLKFSPTPPIHPFVGTPHGTVQVPEFKIRFKLRDDWASNSQALLQEVASSLSSMSDKEGQTLLAGLFGSSIERDCRGLLSLIRYQMRVSSFGRLDEEVVENCQSLLTPRLEYELPKHLQLAIYRLCNNLLLGDATFEGFECLENWERSELIVAFLLGSRLPIVYACAVKILQRAVRIGDACCESLSVLYIFLLVYVCVCKRLNLVAYTKAY